MNRLIALHGKPGTGDDWQPMFQELALFDAWQTVAPSRPARSAPLEALVAALDTTLGEGRPATTVVMGYSWGCYLAVQHLLQGTVKPDALVLVNPYLVAESSISPVVRELLAVPGLGRWLVGRSVQQRALDFLEKSFAPDAVIDSAGRVERLSDPELWLGAVSATGEHHRHPLPELRELPVPVLCLVGGSDTVAAWDTHGQRLPEGPQLTVHTIPGAGHALPWVHLDQTVPLVRTFLSELTT